MMRSAHVVVERKESCAVVTIDRPPLNVLDGETMVELTEVIKELSADAAFHMVAIRGAGRCFSAGADVAEHLPPEVDKMLRVLRELLLAIDAVPIPTLAAVHGMTLGGGLEVALATDRRIATADAKLGNPEIQLGVIAPAAAVLLPDLIGAGPALRFLTTGTEVTANQALAMGLVDQVVAVGEIEAAILAEAASLAKRSRSALVATKKAVRMGAVASDLRDRLEAAEGLYLNDVARSPDGIAGLTAFLERRRKSG